MHPLAVSFSARSAATPIPATSCALHKIAMLQCNFIHSQPAPLCIERGCWLSPPPRRKANNRMRHSPPPVLHFRLSPPILLPGGLFHARKKVRRPSSPRWLLARMKSHMQFAHRFGELLDRPINDRVFDHLTNGERAHARRGCAELG